MSWKILMPERTVCSRCLYEANLTYLRTSEWFFGTQELGKGPRLLISPVVELINCYEAVINF
jgi:hypothetical protein